MKAIEIFDLYVYLGGRYVLEDINIQIEEGEIVAIVGPNGGGKTTLIRTILGLIKPEKGIIKIFGKNIKEAIKEGIIGYLPQRADYEIDFPFSALDVVMLGLINKKMSEKEKRKEALKYIEYVGMSGFEDKPFSKLSGGQKQRISIARVLASEPKIMFLDEPSTGIDVVAQEGFYDFLKRLRDEKGITIVMVSHDIGVVGNFVDKVAGLNKKLHYFGPPKQFLQKDILFNLYGSEVKLLIHSPECITCQHFSLK